MCKTLSPPVHPGEILQEEFMVPLKLNDSDVETDLGLLPGQVTEIINGERRITYDIAQRLARLFGTTRDFWMNLQSLYERELKTRRNNSRQS